MNGFFRALALASSSLLIASPVQASDCPVDAAKYDTQQGKLYLPSIFVEQQGLKFEAQLELLDSQNSFQFQLADLTPLAELVASGQGVYQPENQRLNIAALCLVSDAGEQLIGQVEMQLIPASDPMQLLLTRARDLVGNSIFNWDIAQNKGATFLKDRQQFDALAATGDVSGVIGVREIKFVIIDLDSNHPVLFFMDSVATPLHYDFMRDTLLRYQNITYDQGLTQFSADAYFREDRRHLAGSVVAYDNFNNSQNNDSSGLYTVEFWPTDPVPAKLIEQAYQTISMAMPFLSSPLAYHPVGNTHEQEYQAFAEQFARDNIRTILTDALFGQLDTAVLNKGEAFGRLKVINPGDPNPGEDIIAIYTFIPNTLGHVGGIITEEPQTPLSHINLKARQNDTPNAYIKDVHIKPEYTALLSNSQEII